MEFALVTHQGKTLKMVGELALGGDQRLDSETSSG